MATARKDLPSEEQHSATYAAPLTKAPEPEDPGTMAASIQAQSPKRSNGNGQAPEGVFPMPPAWEGDRREASRPDIREAVRTAQQTHWAVDALQKAWPMLIVIASVIYFAGQNVAEIRGMKETQAAHAQAEKEHRDKLDAHLTRQDNQISEARADVREIKTVFNLFLSMQRPPVSAEFSPPPAIPPSPSYRPAFAPKGWGAETQSR